MNNLTHPLRLAIGSHEKGSGKGCAMNVVSWENGDSTISDMPACTDRMLARIVQRVNDSYCTHTDDGLLCPACSIDVLALAHRTVGTGDIGLTSTALRQMWVGVAADQARSVLHLAKDKAKAEANIQIAERYAATGEKPAASAAAYAAADAAAAAAASAVAAASAYASASADASAYAAAYAVAAADAYADADADAAAYAAAYAAAAASAAYVDYADYAARSRSRMAQAHRAIDAFQRLTGHVSPAIDQTVVRHAYAQMITA